MFKKHPKGLVAASLSNMGERFGFYIMMAILTLFLMAKFGLSDTYATVIYSIFYGLTYGLALVGGIIADRTKKYKSTIQIGIILMAVGYVILAIPTPTPVLNVPLYLTISCIGLAVIAFGNGLFKGNLQALVGQMYDNKEYSKMRDSGFSLFYMFINVGAIFAPLIAVGMRNWWLKVNGFLYSAALPERCHEFLRGEMSPDKIKDFAKLAGETTVSGTTPADLTTFATSYLEVFTTGYHYAFAVAIIAMLISLTIYMINKRRFPDPAQKKEIDKTNPEVQTEMDPNEIKQRLYALFAVFSVVIFFWLSFHQNGASLTYFAKDYINVKGLSVNVFGLFTIEGVEIFQSINPFFVVFLTPIILSVFGWLRAKGKEPSTPRKIGIGMGIAGLAYLLLTIQSIGLPSATEVKGMASGLPEAMQLSPMIMVLTYLILTIAELFISPLGISFVSKVAPPKYQGLMQGCWLGATALANSFLWIGTVLYNNIPLWSTWLVFVAACGTSMIIMLLMLRWLERITK